MKKIFISDCEGPISKNDNAFELTSHYVQDGEKLFTALSLYDDALADVLKRPGHRAGSTLKFIIPFLKACGVTDQMMREFSQKSLITIAHAKESMAHVQKIAHSFIVSTSFEQYIQVLCQTLDFPFKNAYCTRVSLDAYDLTDSERAKLLELKKEIARMPLIKLKPRTESQDGLSVRDRETIRRLDEIFGEELAGTESERIFREVKPVGGMEKAESVKDIVKNLNSRLEDVMYVGDSITDSDAFKLVKEGGGLSVSFNGNRYAIENTQIAILSENSLTTAVIADEFCKSGKAGTLRLVENWNHETLSKTAIDVSLCDQFLRAYRGDLPTVKIITEQNMNTLAEESTEFRKKVRGESIGRLG